MTSVEGMLLRGRCRFEFEGHEFIPEGETRSFENACWLQASDAVKQKLAALLGVDQAVLEFSGWIEMTFHGQLIIAADGWRFGHGGMFSRQATIDKVIEARILAPAVKNTGTRMSIRERLQQHKKAKAELESRFPNAAK